MSNHSITHAQVWQALTAILDPEFAISIVDLGLIYSVECLGNEVKVVMTLTTPTCPSGGWIHEGVRAALFEVPGVTKVDVDLVFEPRWTTEMLTESARRLLGFSVGQT